MTQIDLENIVKNTTDFASVRHYKQYLQQLCDNNRDSGTVETARDYAMMVDMLNALERTIG